MSVCSESSYFLGTSFPLIGDPEFPYHFPTLEAAERTAREISRRGYPVKIYFTTTIQIEHLLKEIEVEAN